MKKILSFLLIIVGLYGYSQDEYYRIIDWKFYPENVIQLTDSTYLTDAYPFDYNDVGAIQRVVGNYVVDFVGHRYSVIDSTSTTITVLDIYHIGQAPQTGQMARCYRSVGNGEAEYIGSIDYSPLDESSRWKLNGSDNELLWRQTIGKAENGLYKELRTAKLGGDLTEPTTINQADNLLKILNNGHGSVFSQTGIAYTKIDTVDFTDSTLVTKRYVKSLIKHGTNHDSLTIAPGSADYFEVNYPQIFSGQKLIDSLGVINTKIAGKEPLLTKGNLTAGSSKVTIGGTGTGAVIGAGVSIDINEANIVHQNISGSGTNTHAQIDTHIINDGDLSSTNEIQDLSLSGNTLSLSGDTSTVDLSGYAPASGSANYVQVSPVSAQSGNIFMDGNIKIKSDFNIFDGFIDLAGFNFSGADTDPWFRYYRPTGVTSTQTYIWQQIINDNGNSLDFGYAIKDRGSEILSDFKTKGSIDRLGKMAINSLGKLPRSDINYVFEGDSRVAAYGNDWPLYLQSKSNFANTGYFYNVATGGNNIANIISQYATEVYPHRPTGSITKSYLFVLIGINDLSSGTPDASALWISLLGYINQAQSDGFSVVAFTTFYRQTLTDDQEKARQELNDYIRYNSINQSYILIDLESLFPPTSVSIYYGDDVHLNPNSNKLIAEYVNYCFSLAHNGVTLINRTSNQNVFTPPPGENFKINGAINTTGYKLSGVDLFGSLTTGSRTKWDGTKLIDDTDTFAPASGSANYVQVSPLSPQAGNIWMDGSIKTENGVYVNGFNGLITTNYIPDSPNKIWSFGDSPNVGITYYQGSSAGGGSNDAIAFSFGIPGFEGVRHLFYNNGNFGIYGVMESSGYKLSGVNLYSSLTANTLQKWDGTKHTSISNASGYLYNDGTGNMSFTSIPAAVTSISAGNGMNFTTITGTGSVTLGTPTTLTASTTNAVTTTSHTHQITGFLPLTGGTLTGAVTSNNSFTGTNFILSSDKRLKQGIRTLTNTDWVERIKFVRYEMKSDPETERYGVIAQDVEEVNKYLVHTDEYGIKSVSYIDLLVAKIANLEKRISELENKKKRHEK